MCAYSLEKGSSFLQGILVVRETEIYAHCPCFQVSITKFRDTLVCRDKAVENHYSKWQIRAGSSAYNITHSQLIDHRNRSE